MKRFGHIFQNINTNLFIPYSELISVVSCHKPETTNFLGIWKSNRLRSFYWTNTVLRCIFLAFLFSLPYSIAALFVLWRCSRLPCQLRLENIGLLSPKLFQPQGQINGGKAITSNCALKSKTGLTMIGAEPFRVLFRFGVDRWVMYISGLVVPW